MTTYNPLNLGAPIGSPSSSATHVQPAQPQHDAPPVSIPPARDASSSNASYSLGPTLYGDTAPALNRASYIPPNPPPLAHVRTAPTTLLPTRAAMHQEGGDGGGPELVQDVLPRGKLAGSAPSDSDESTSATLHGNNSPVHDVRAMPEHLVVPLSAGGLHGQPLPGSHQARAHGDLSEKDHQAASVGGKTGPEVAGLAKKELGVNADGDIADEKSAKKAHAAVTANPVLGSGYKIERTNTGTHVARHQTTSGGQNTVQALGLVPVTRQMSQPPAVSPFGGISPSGIDAEEGLSPVRSHEEEEEREELRKEKGPDPWAVKFEPGEKTNPKVSARCDTDGRATTFPLQTSFLETQP